MVMTNVLSLSIRLLLEHGGYFMGDVLFKKALLERVLGGL